MVRGGRGRARGLGSRRGAGRLAGGDVPLRFGRPLRFGKPMRFGKHVDVVQRLTRELDAFRQMAGAARLKPDTETAKGLTKEQIEHLRSLGYLK